MHKASCPTRKEAWRDDRWAVSRTGELETELGAQFHRRRIPEPEGRRPVALGERLASCSYRTGHSDNLGMPSALKF
jgi:hypothetical protein